MLPSIRTLFVFLLVATVAGAAPLHLELRSSAPTAGAVLNEAPPEFRLEFTAEVTAAFSSVHLFQAGPDSLEMPLDFHLEGGNTVVAVSGQDLVPGAYQIRWRVAGADGHPMTGTIPFSIAGAVQLPSGDTVPVRVPAPGLPGAAPDRLDAPLVEDPASPESGGILIRFLTFLSFTLAFGSFSLTGLLMHRLRRTGVVASGTLARIENSAASLGMIAAVGMLAGLTMRIVAQSADLRAAGIEITIGQIIGADGPRGGLVAGIASALITLTGFALARLWRSEGRGRWLLAAVGLGGFAYSIAATGHASAVITSVPVSPVLVAGIHVIVAGTWIGTLAAIMICVIPPAVRSPEPGNAILAATIMHFSPIALVSVAILLITGGINTWIQLGSIEAFVTTRYGIILLVKLGVVAAVATLGAYNWRVIKPRLGEASGAGELRMTASVETALGIVVLLVTAVLVMTPQH